MFEKWFPNVDITELWTTIRDPLYDGHRISFSFIIGAILGLLLF